MADSEKLAEKAASSSTETFLTALVANGAFFLISVGAFTILRPWFDAVYQPRTYAPPAARRILPLTMNPNPMQAMLQWPVSLYRVSYKDIIKANGLDAYFFVRFLFMMAKTFLPIWVISWGVLLPLTSVGTHVEPNKGLNRFTFGNVANTDQERYWAHIALIWLFTRASCLLFLFCSSSHLTIVWIFFNIKREMANYVITRQKHLIDSEHASSVQANTILVTGVPEKYLSQDALRKVFSHLPGGVKKIWINRDLKELPDIYDRRLAACNKLEGAETDLLRTAAKLRIAAKKSKTKNSKDHEYDPEAADTSLVPRDKRPQHKLGFLGLLGQKVDTIEWAREEIRICNDLLERGRASLDYGFATGLKSKGHSATGSNGISAPRPLSSAPPSEEGSNKEAEGAKKPSFMSKIPIIGGPPPGEENPLGGKPFPALASTLPTEGKDVYPRLSSAFITFNQQIAAHLGAQALTHHAPYRMAEKYVEVAPEDVVWGNLSLNPYERKLRMLAGYAATAALIIFWAIPVAFVGVISNIGQLCVKYKWLNWLCKIPSPVYGIISGILPPVLLAVLMMLLPIILRLFSRLEGVPTRSHMELSLMNRFFIFQVIHSFLIVTLSSGLIYALQDLASNPTSIPTILAQKLPQASVFFLTYVVLQGLSGVAGGFLQIIPLILYYVKLFILGSTPRAVYNIKYGARNVAWGTLFPSVTLLVVIALGYSIIAPIINGFACATFFLFFVVYKYLFLYTFQQPIETDTGGLFFPKAIQHLFVGLYVQQICLAALFFLARDENNKASSVPQGALTIVLVIATVHI
ncbi:hypothetical protein HGRIS_011638 [Hohenbuehelia grisea]|uniref:DUF221-domain-containing protein n=1 Tax=Hohenbuehelia grisea TaxID=104357 RepID=A0ABR3JWJ0_9AGAR